jgi:hypothetical protein
MQYDDYIHLRDILESLQFGQPFASCSIDPNHESERAETNNYLKLAEFNTDDQVKILLRVATHRENPLTNTFSGGESHRFNWNGSVLGEFSADRSEGIRKGIRYVAYDQMFPLAFNSATLSPPRPEAARAAFVTAKMLSHFAVSRDSQNLEKLVADVSRTAFENLCRRYRVDTHDSEVLFDDNATMALFQYLGMLEREPNKFAFTFFDTGRVMPQALEGKNPEFLPDNFLPAMDVWGNRDMVKKHFGTKPPDLLPWKCDLIQHYTDRYLSDEEILDQAILMVETSRPELIVIPTVTRTGRRVAFIELCEAIRGKAEELGYSPLIVLDDAQGLGRMSQSRYFQREDGSSTHLWDYADAVLLTGAKVTGALMGSGAILFNKESFQKRQMPFGLSPLQYRSRQYAFMSDDLDRVVEHNRAAPGIAQSPEIASLSMALSELPKPEEVYNLMRQMREFVVDRLKQIPGIKVLEPERDIKARFEDSIIAFYLEDYPEEVRKFREYLSIPREANKPHWDNYPITLPAVITADKRQYLRMALDPARAVSKDESYLLKVSYVLDTFANVMKKHFPAKS